ncbi:hypothetical protein TRVL_07587 [Trypanosoma vivax]|nr:hypothetical protein TRVL_07587 [Trypanosoma vivax]
MGATKTPASPTSTQHTSAGVPGCVGHEDGEEGGNFRSRAKQVCGRVLDVTPFCMCGCAFHRPPDSAPIGVASLDGCPWLSTHTFVGPQMHTDTHECKNAPSQAR